MIGAPQKAIRGRSSESEKRETLPPKNQCRADTLTLTQAQDSLTQANQAKSAAQDSLMKAYD